MPLFAHAMKTMLARLRFGVVLSLLLSGACATESPWGGAVAQCPVWGETCPFVQVQQQKVESDGIGIRFLARHLVKLDFPRQTLYLQPQSVGPLPDPRQKIPRLSALDPLVQAVLVDDFAARRTELACIDQSDAGTTTKTIAEKLVGTLENVSKPSPAEVAAAVNHLALVNARPKSVGFRSAAIHGEEHPRYAVDVTGVKALELIVEPAVEHNGGNWALWLDPNLTR